MKRKKRTPEEREAERAEAEASIKHLREHVARERAKLEAKRRAEAEKPRGLRRLLSL
jgi:hypothetical protein